MTDDPTCPPAARRLSRSRQGLALAAALAVGLAAAALSAAAGPGSGEPDGRPPAAGAVARTANYVVAHQDDWLLFMNPDVSNDLGKPGTKVVIVHTSAGDNGWGEQYWKAREEGAVSAIRFRTAPPLAAAGTPLVTQEGRGTAVVNRHVVHFWYSNAVACYFLRLPDGSRDGNGYARYGNQSLTKLQDGTIPSLTSVDGLATYPGWNDLAATLQAVLDREAAGAGTPSLGSQDTDTTVNPGDHPDHLATGAAVQAMARWATYDRRLYVDYALGGKDDPELTTDADLFWKLGMFSAYLKAVYDPSLQVTINSDPAKYMRWAHRASKSRVPAGK